MADIKAIDKTTVHRICSGQVVLSLAIAVKELVENSLDAGATVIDVKFKEFGSDLIEVADNGSGIHPNNFQGLTLKHYTSKIQNFSDVFSVETFGFRGEALSSLCALSELSVVTRHQSQQCGTALVFNKNGSITEEKRQARQVGTTLFVKNLFSTLPVRQKEFHKNLKREFHKMTQLLYAYCLVSTGVKITCTNQTQKGSRSTIMSTQGSKSVKENISSLFGSKQLNTLLDIKKAVPPQEELEEFKANVVDCNIISFEGYVSSCAHGSGKSASNRQFYFINSRPCEPHKIIKLVNQVYHQFNKHQFPFVFLNISLERELADVNVTPDKRQVFLIHEKLIIAIIKASLLELYEKIPSTLVVNKISLSNNFNSALQDQFGKPNNSKFEAWKHRSDLKRCSDICNVKEVPQKQSRKEAQKTECDSNKGCLETNEVQHNIVQLKDEVKVLNSNTDGEISRICYEKPKTNFTGFLKQTDNKTLETQSTLSRHKGISFTNSNISENISPNVKSLKPVNDNNHTAMNQQYPISSQDYSDSDSFPERSATVNDLANQNVILKDSEINLCDSALLPTLNLNENLSAENNMEEFKAVVYDEYEGKHSKLVKVPVNIQIIRSALEKRIQESKKAAAARKTIIKFHASIDPSKNEEAEKELTKEISKDMFKKMEIIGQFNLGFIIAKLDSDLLIIDQHATDEKYNFETLQKTTILNTQRLVVPQSLDLTAEHECILMDNLTVFNTNGFKFHIDEEG